MLLHIIAGAFFSVTIILAAKDIPPKTVLSGIITAAALTAADLFMITRLSAASEEYMLLDLFLTENKTASVSLFPDIKAYIVGGIHNIITETVGLIRRINETILGFFDDSDKIAAFTAAAFTVSAAAVIIFPEKKCPESESVEPARAIRIIVLNLFTDSFFAAPAAGVIIYGLCCILNIEYAAIICTVMWLLSYIPFIGQAAGIILGVCILIASCHPVLGIIFGVSSAAVYIIADFGKKLAVGFYESEKENDINHHLM